MKKDSVLWKSLSKINRLRRVIIHKHGKRLIAKSLTSNPKRIFYFGMPEHSNMGDLGQYYCLLDWLKRNYVDYDIIECLSSIVLDKNSGFDRFLKSIVKPEDIFVIHSGYNTNDLSTVSNKLNLYLIGEYLDNLILVFPQTVFFKEEKNLLNSSKIFNKHEKLIFMARDSISYDITKKMIPDGHVMMIPDIVTSLIGSRKEVFDREGIVLCHRKDGEQYYTDSDFLYLKDRLDSNENVLVMDTTITLSRKKIVKNLYKYIIDIISVFEKHKIVITDRYHGMIYSLVSNTPVIVLKTIDHKVVEGYNLLKKVYPDRIFFADSIDDAINKCNSILQNPNYKKLDNYFEREIYMKLKNQIEQELRI